MKEPIQFAISGAAGRIGYSLIFRIAAGGLFGPDQPVALSLLDLPERLPMLQADEIELRDCAFPLLADLRIGVDPDAAFRGADWVILLAGKPIFPGQLSRLDLLRANAPIYVRHGRAINEACPTARILVVANPCNTNALIASMRAPNVPREHWFALNRMDRMRATWLIAEKAGVPVREVNRVTVWGNHSELAYADFHNAFIGDVPAPEVITDPAWPREVLQPALSTRTRHVVDLRRGSPAATAAQAILGTIHSITRPTPVHRRFGAAVFAPGDAYSVPGGLVFGLPLRTEDGVSWAVEHGLYLDEFAQGRIAANVAELGREATIAAEVVEGL